MQRLWLAVGVLLLLPHVAVAEPIPMDVTVSFSVCMNEIDPQGNVCVIGNAVAIGEWNTGVTMTDNTDDTWSVDVVFPAGTDSAVEYKFKRADCSDWEQGGNRSFELPLDGSPVVRSLDSYDYISPIGCGQSAPLSEDKTLCFKVCMEGVTFTGGNCIIGNVTELGAWGTGVALSDLGNDEYETCVTWAQGTLVPLTVEYKFQTDDCDTWEQLGGDPFANRSYILDESTLKTTNLSHVWADGDGDCSSVATHDKSWGAVKSNYED